MRRVEITDNPRIPMKSYHSRADVEATPGKLEGNVNAREALVMKCRRHSDDDAVNSTYVLQAFRAVLGDGHVN